MTITVFTNADGVCSYSSVFLLSGSPIVGGGVASFTYTIATQGTYLDNIDAMTSNRQVLQKRELKAMVKGFWSWLLTDASLTKYHRHNDIKYPRIKVISCYCSWTANIPPRKNGVSSAAAIVLLRCCSRTAVVRLKLGASGLSINTRRLARRLNALGMNVVQE